MMTLQGRLRACFNDISQEAANKIDDLERQLANALVRDIHSCHADCDRVECVNARLRKEVEALEAALRQARESLEYLRDTAICQADTDVANEALAAIEAALRKEQP